jgi:hypothetical protein
VERIAGLDAAGATLREIAAATGVSTFSVRNALGRVPSAGQGAAVGVAAGDPLPVQPDPVPRQAERALARWGLLGEGAAPVFAPGARYPLAGLLLALPVLEGTGAVTSALSPPAGPGTTPATAHASPRTPGTATCAGPAPHPAPAPPAPAAAARSPPAQHPAARRAPQLPARQLPLDHIPVTVYREHDASKRQPSGSPRASPKITGRAAPDPTRSPCWRIPKRATPQGCPATSATPATQTRRRTVISRQPRTPRSAPARAPRPPSSARCRRQRKHHQPTASHPRIGTPSDAKASRHRNPERRPTPPSRHREPDHELPIGSST